MRSGTKLAIAFFSAALLGGCDASLVQASRGTALPSIASEKASSAALLYLSDVKTNDVGVYTYPQGKLVGKLTGMGEPRSECADSSGNVWIADVQAEQVVEYAHAASRPSVALSTFGPPRGCAVDSKSGDLAVSGGINGTVLSVYHRGKRGWRDPRRYSDASLGAARFCGYDASGNLFIDGASKGGAFRLAELPRRASSLVNLSVTQHIAAPGQVQWDGEALAVGDTGVSPSAVYRFSISGKTATKLGVTKLDDAASVRQFWIQGETLIGPDFGSNVRFWNFPGGGSPTKTVTSIHGYGATISAP